MHYENSTWIPHTFIKQGIDVHSLRSVATFVTFVAETTEKGESMVSTNVPILWWFSP